MNIFEAFILGIIQGLTEFLPVSSSGHLELGKALLQTEFEENLLFTVVVHGATVLSTIIIFFREIKKITVESFHLKLNDSNRYVLKIIISMIPVLLVALFLKEEVEHFFEGNLNFVGGMLLVTASLLGLTYFIKTEGKKNIPYLDAFIIGIAQAFAVLPGISRSGATIATGVLLGNKKSELAQFSFLMVLIPIIGANLLEVLEYQSGSFSSSDAGILIAGFFAAFISGLFACSWMIKIVKRGKLIYFAVYCAIIGILAILL